MAKLQEYRCGTLVVRFDPERCIHSEECVHRLPEVFNPKTSPWIQPDRALPVRIAEVVGHCPTGALSADLGDGRCYEMVPGCAQARIGPDGPLYLRGQLDIVDAGGEAHRETRVALCRCGASSNKPFCDNRHRGIRFADPGVLSEAAAAAMAAAAAAGEVGTLRITPLANGPLRVTGPLTLIPAEGAEVFAGPECFLCRCGGSGNKPFCDGTHKRIGFVAEGEVRLRRKVEEG